MLAAKNIRIALHTFIKTGVFSICACTSAWAQENTMFFVNPYSFNPSYAGVEGRPAFFLNYRRQWVNVDGSPKTGNLSFHTPLKKFVSVGANITNDKRGLFNTTTALVSGAYTVMLGDFKSMRFGLSAGGGTTGIDMAQVSPDDDDPALTSAGNSFLQGSAGLSFHLKSFHGGIALPSLFEPSYISGTASSLDPLQTVVIHASNRFYFLKNRHVLEPHLVYRYRSSQPSQAEAALVYHLDNVLWIGGSYKQHFGNSAFAGFHFNKVFGIGYGYTFKTSGTAELNSPSHEIQLTLLLGQKRKDIPFYSFVDTDKEKRVHHHKYQSASEAIAKNRANKPAPKEKPPVNENHQARLPENASKKPATPSQKNPPQKTQQPVVTKQPEQKPPVVVAQQTPVKQQTVSKTNQPVKKLGEMPHVHDTLHPAHEEEKEKIKRLEVHAVNPTQHHEAEITAHPHAERHEFVKRGGHQEEMEIGDYVIAGVFRSKINAQHFADGLIKHGFKTVDHGHLTEKNLWYVYLAHTDNLDKAKAERDKYRKMLIFRDAWLLTVHH